MSLTENHLCVESRRLSELDAYKILDTPPEDCFDELTRLAAEILGAPIALVSLVDEHRQWFKSAYGLVATETPREHAFCAHAIQSADVFVVPDAQKDIRFAHNPLVVGAPFIRFYAGAPLESPQGFRLGTLCVIDDQARELDERQKRVLEILSRQVVAHMERSKVKRERAVYQAILEKQKLQISESSKLAALGEMAAGIAHEINNPLAIMQAKIALLERQLNDAHFKPKQSLPILKNLEATLQRISTIIKGLKNFAREGSNDIVQNFSIGELIKDTLSFCKERIRGRGIQLEIQAAANSKLMVRGRSVQISQILLNLLNNAYDASENYPRPFIGIELRELKNEVELRVINSGPLIDEVTRKKIFEPFFTTKEVGKGTGLGLSVSKGLAESNGALLFLDEAAAQTCFVLKLPRSN